MPSVRKIKVNDYSNIMLEKVANADILPGLLVALDSDDKFGPVGTPIDMAVPYIAIEDQWQNKNPEEKTDSGDICFVSVGTIGNEYNLVLKAGENVAIGDSLQVADGGKVEKATSIGVIVAQAMEAVNADGGEDEFIKARIVPIVKANDPVAYGDTAVDSEFTLFQASSDPDWNGIVVAADTGAEGVAYATGTVTITLVDATEYTVAEINALIAAGTGELPGDLDIADLSVVKGADGKTGTNWAAMTDVTLTGATV